MAETPKLPPALQARVRAILEGPQERRHEALEALCKEHPDCEAAILAAEPTLAASATGQALEEEVSHPGRVGPYKILDVLGEGGMGTVYLAEQKDPVRRLVALKVIKLGMDSKEVLARFELERRALAAMSHTSIAKVFDAGKTDRGQPYFVMEHVEGAMPLTAHCDQHKLDLKQRIELFQRVCAGVHHAHQKGVIHRDLKPGNILVTREGERAVPKIIDFGLARATNRDLLAQTIYTDQERLIGTPEYMAPEQASADPELLDTTADIYSLGVILYELLTSQLPFSREDLRKAGWLEIRRKLAEDEPPKPSTRVSSGDDSTALHRRTTIHALARELRRDLDWVILKSMAKEPERRYESASGLAADLQRYLDLDPVMAGPPSPAYRLRKFARRYRTVVIAIAAVVVILLVGITTSSALAVRMARAEASAQSSLRKLREQRRRDARRVSRLDAIHQGLVVGADLLVREVKATRDWEEALKSLRLDLRVQAERVSSRLLELLLRATEHDIPPLALAAAIEYAAQVFSEAAVRNDLLRVLQPNVPRFLEHALKIRRAEHGAGAAEVVECELLVAQAYLGAGDLWAAHAHARSAATTSRRFVADEPLLLADSLDVLVNVLRATGRRAEAQRAQEEAMRLRSTSSR